MAQKSAYVCCRTANIEELSSHIRSLPTDKLSSHLEQCKVRLLKQIYNPLTVVPQLVMDLLFSRLQDALALRETSLDSETYDSSNDGDGDDGDVSNGDGGDECYGIGRQSQKEFRCKRGCRSFKRRQELVRHYLRRKFVSVYNTKCADC